MGGHEYWLHRYEGALNGIDKAVVLISYPKSAFGNKNALRVFICSDCGLADETILGHYTHRWKIEVMFKQQKMYMGLKSYGRDRINFPGISIFQHNICIHI